MAELSLIPYATATYDNGDCLCAFDDNRIGWTHCESLLHVKHEPVAPGDLRPMEAMSRRYRQRRCEFRFERISGTEVRKIIVATGKIVDTFSNVPVLGQAIAVDEFVWRQLHRWRPAAYVDKDERVWSVNSWPLNRVPPDQFPQLASATFVPGGWEPTTRHAVYGERLAEVWYGGGTRFDDATLDNVWQDIEDYTPHRRVNYRRFPNGTKERQLFMRIAVQNFTPAVRAELESPLTLAISPDEVQIVKNRKYWIDWASRLGLSAADRDKALTLPTYETYEDVIFGKTFQLKRIATPAPAADFGDYPAINHVGVVKVKTI